MIEYIDAFKKASEMFEYLYFYGCREYDDVFVFVYVDNEFGGIVIDNCVISVRKSDGKVSEEDALRFKSSEKAIRYIKSPDREEYRKKFTAKSDYWNGFPDDYDDEDGDE